MTRATLTDSPGARGDASPYPLGLTLVYSDGLARTGEQVSLAGRAAVLLGRDGALFPGGPLADARASSRHAALTLDGGDWVLVDPGSKNGTFVDGTRVTRCALEAGQVIRIGSTFIVFGRVPRTPLRRGVLSGVGAAAAEVEDALALVAPSEHTVLLVGESGTGKEVVARELHRASGRAGPFLAINCASLRGELLESELFGHVKGAFTGAAKAHEGLFARARDGTVFLDEIGEMEPAAQARLLRVLETRAIRPVGATDEVPVGTRVVGATNRALDTLVAGQHLRADLYARLARWTVALPPLRARKEDLGLLVRTLLDREAPGLDVTPDLMAELLASRWPLNVRGLVNVLTAARIAQPSAARLDLVEHVRRALAAQAHAEALDPAGARPEPTPERVTALLAKHRGNVARVAGELDVSRQSLYRLLERLGLDPARFR